MLEKVALYHLVSFRKKDIEPKSGNKKLLKKNLILGSNCSHADKLYII